MAKSPSTDRMPVARARVGEEAGLARPSDPPVSRALTADEHIDRIVEAAVCCFRRWGVARTRVDDIAADLGKTRPYLYRYFSSKDAIVLEVVVRSIRQHNAALRERFPLEGPAEEVVVRSLVQILRHARENEYTAALLADDATHTTAQALASAPEVLDVVREYWEPVLGHARTHGELRDGASVESACRWLTFLQFSYLSLPELVPASDAHLEQQIREHVVPSILMSRR